MLISDKLQEHYPSLEPELRRELVENAFIRDFKAGEVLMKPGQYFKSTMLITKGRVKVYKEGDDGSEFFMYYLEPGNACALSMICAARQEQSELLARTTEDTEVILIPIALMDNLMSKYRTWYYFVLETYRNRFEELLNLIDHTVFKGLDERLEFYLKKQRGALKTDELRLTHEEIANDLGTSRVVVSRLLKAMEQNGKLKLFRNYIDLKNLPV
ncbi:MAG: Crp/Fnr family transcriptional regulator [Bacteroidia bacterium]|nr:Crp/Fnr family transcriptional regulator [Bacteroidia bacterium]